MVKNHDSDSFIAKIFKWAGKPHVLFNRITAAGPKLQNKYLVS